MMSTRLLCVLLEGRRRGRRRVSQAIELATGSYAQASGCSNQHLGTPPPHEQPTADECDDDDLEVEVIARYRGLERRVLARQQRRYTADTHADTCLSYSR